MKRPQIRYYDSLSSESYRTPPKTDAENGKGFAADGNYRYIGNEKNPFYRFVSFIVYRVIMTPVAFLYCRLYLGMRFEDRRTEKPAKGRGCFLFRNHVLTVGDAFEPSVEMTGRKVAVVVSPRNMSLKGTRTFLKMCGALPVPSGLKAARAFSKAIEKRLSQGCCVTVYPEAHIWPYYDGIRPFSRGSFAFAVKTGAPVYVSTTVFRNVSRSPRPRVTTVLDGPFYPDKTLLPREAEKELSQRVRTVMTENAARSCGTGRYVKYVENGKGMTQ